jgi:uncharacterized protein YbbK (DUF523 family)
MVVPVLITSCQVSEKPNSRPTAPHSTTIPTASVNACVLPVHRVTAVDICSSRALTDEDFRFGMRRMIAVGNRPRIGISSCLVGERVRYNGGDKRDAWLADVLGPQVDWVPVCPEVEAGFGTPREPMELVRDSRDGIMLMTTTPRPDLTARLHQYSARRVDELAALDLDGYVLKAGSPSCAISTRINAAAAANVATRGPGLFAAALMRRLPDLPVVDEQQLGDRDVRQRFVERVFARARAQRVGR